MKNKKIGILATILVACISAYMIEKYDDTYIGLICLFTFFVGMLAKEMERM